MTPTELSFALLGVAGVAQGTALILAPAAVSELAAGAVGSTRAGLSASAKRRRRVAGGALVTVGMWLLVFRGL